MFKILLMLAMMMVATDVTARVRYEYRDGVDVECQRVLVKNGPTKTQKLMNAVVNIATLPTINPNTTYRGNGVYSDTIGNMRPSPRSDAIGNAAAYMINQDSGSRWEEQCTYTPYYKRSFRVEY